MLVVKWIYRGFTENQIMNKKFSIDNANVDSNQTFIEDIEEFPALRIGLK